jgi:SWI/SNF-related matrix-associated actin-dependent regulator of chromatin subfamily A member 5
MIDPLDPNPQASEDIVTASGKMMMLDRLLPKLQAAGHRVVMFSQYTRVLDILSDYLHMRGYIYTRLDGSTHRVNREVRINQFNKPGSNTFLFLLSTRAGGEGVNLFTADTVILFDSDWNPQVRCDIDFTIMQYQSNEINTG